MVSCWAVWFCATLTYHTISADTEVIKFVIPNPAKEVKVIVTGNVGEEKVRDILSCSDLCASRHLCSSYFYNNRNHSCVLQGDVLSPESFIDTGWKYWYRETTKSKENTLNCSEGEQVVSTGDHTTQCEPGSQRLSSDVAKDRQQKMTRLLMFPFYDAQQFLPVKQFFFENKTVRHISLIEADCTSAVAYIPSKRKLVVASWASSTLRFVSIDGTDKILKRNVQVNGVAVDSNKQTVFLTTSCPHKGISAMTTEGRNFRSLATIPKCFLVDIAVDLKRSLIYVTCRGENIHTVTYQGVHKGPLAGPKWVVGPLGINLVEDSLYFVQLSDASVFKMSLSDHIVKKVIKFELEVYAIFATSNSVYVSLLFSRRLYTIHKSNISVLTDTGYNEKTVKGVHMCGVP